MSNPAQLRAPSGAPIWLQLWSPEIERRITGEIWPFASKTPCAIADLPDASTEPYLLRFVTDGANGPLVWSNGSGWVYMDGVSV